MQLHDLTEVRWVNKIPQWIATPHTNLPYPIIRAKMNLYNSSSNRAVNSRFIPVKNGESPLDKLKKNESN